MSQCYYCSTEIDPASPVYRSSTCPKCGRDLKVCKNCSYYSEGLAHDCRENVQETVKDKELANFCDFFHLLDKANKINSNKTKQNTALEQFNSLFK